MSGSTEKMELNINLTAAAEKRLQELVKRYPSAKSAVMPALSLAQEELGWVTDQAVAWVSNRLNLPRSHVREVATFYTMYYKKPVGKYHIQICRTLSCYLCGAQELSKYLRQRFRLTPGEISSDGMWSWEEVECLGSCGTAPMAEINDCYFEKLTSDALGQLLDRIEREQPDLRYSTIVGALGGGLKGHPKSEVWTRDEGL